MVIIDNEYCKATITDCDAFFIEVLVVTKNKKLKINSIGDIRKEKFIEALRREVIRAVGETTLTGLYE